MSATKEKNVLPGYLSVPPDSSSVKGDKIAPPHDVAGRMGDLTEEHTGNSVQHAPALCKGSLSSSLPLSWRVRAAHSRGVIG